MPIISHKHQGDCCKKKYSEIQAEVTDYVMQRPLHRPRINRFLAIVIFLTDVGLALALSFLIGNLFSITKYIALIFVFIFVHTLRLLGIVFVKCYQHHASEKRRRRCLCMPTCSEYAILCFKKYIFVYAIIKIRKRLYVTCKGEDYKIDWP
jgi:putative component of membrane protein insertase Oxa1/YidC/SpoIIIJ protein YidD